MKSRMLPLFIAAALACGCAQAADPQKPAAAAPAAPTAQQQAARAEIERLTARIQELSTQLGDGANVKVIIRRAGDGPGMHHDGMPPHAGMGPGMDHDIMIERMGPGMDHDEMMERMGGPEGEGPRKIRIERIEGPGGMRMGPEAMRHGPGLGIVLAPNTAATGVRIAAVTPDSPAQKAKLMAGDVLLSVNGKSVGGGGVGAVDRARDLLGDLKKGQVVKLRVARQGKTVDADVVADDIGRVVMINRGEGMHGDMRRRGMMLPPGVEMEIERVGVDCKKGDKDCGMPMMFQAFRWQGLNLSSIDAGLGRYFGTDKGVLVISAGPDMKGLQSGDVIQRVGGTAVDSPREVMRALRDKDEGAQLQVDVLRDRKPASVTLTVPKSRPLPFIAPPPAPPAPPRAPGAAPPPPPAPPAKPAAMVGDDGDFEV